MPKAPVPDTILRLVDNFNRNLDACHSSAYNEAQLRQDFLNPFFEAMGWDMANKQGFDQRYRQVIHEAALRIGGTTKAPDYSFRIGGVRKFFVEAKKPAHDLKHDIGPALQLRRYAWTAKLPLSILTDFEEFCVYETRTRPKKTDKPATGRISYIRFQEYPDRWEEITGIFSPKAIQQGSFDRFAEAKKGKRGTAEVDAEFLKDIEHWRDLLARNIALRNPRLTNRDLNFAVQRTIDRIIFLRICEDRGIERTDSLQALLNGTRTYRRLFELFFRADERYNSGLFHFSTEKGRAEPDEVTPKLKLDDKILKEIIGNLYYPDSPYEFSVFPADILGHVYEQFLGKVIRLTAGHRAKVEYKPEVRKAGGVYYTPTYIVDYIVKNTVGKLLEGKPGPKSRPLTPAQASRLRILDPACGSGSFLLGAFQYLLDWHRDWYEKHGPEKHRKVLYQGPGGEWRLTTGEKKRILLNNIFGVDIDSQAVEVTKLSLLLKVLEGESEETINYQFKIFRERALPDLSSNIKCGNSLIGSDFYEGEQQALFDDEEQRLRINVFDWEDEFPEIMKRGGFDAVIGNPPYVRAVRLTQEKQFYDRRFRAAYGSYDIYVLFMEAALHLVRKGGLVSMIVPNKFLVADYAKQLRQILLTEASLYELADLGRCRSVFQDALISSAIPFLVKGVKEVKLNLKILDDETAGKIASTKSTEVRCSELVSPEGNILVYQDHPSRQVLKKIRAAGEPLSRVALVRTGVMGFEYWSLDRWISDGNKGRRIATNSYIDRYRLLWGKKVRIYGRETYEPRLDPGCSLLSQGTMKMFASPKIVVRGVARRVTATLDREGIGILVAVHAVVGRKYSNEFLLGLLNSTLFNWLHVVQFYSARIPQGSLRYPVSFWANLPIAQIDKVRGSDKARHDKIVRLVERMLKLHKDLPKAKGQTKTAIDRRIKATDRQIDELVYELYGLTEKEIGIVEKATQA
ncbi:hypothetical protein CH330_00325 [candidate division WOR-3 bacterium JGI_Cruoil_03_51_56]|uniref:site-specific DNA-methyltransferase (adenine-specific) n=1 Tax=candidate division WOR-3 bacterium JGI_Cruoil_03_51_56 TaxID=1973747 RepID=A0A235C0M8_UNCW3|nr:MAG: hypothetical protein CH330_00325 [candidate division WOR-3 bacterium JGI_Cruoil_03_51_56]